jgi:hypothetical protein
MRQPFHPGIHVLLAGQRRSAERGPVDHHDVIAARLLRLASIHIVSRLDLCRLAGESVQSGRDASGVASDGLELGVLTVGAIREAGRGGEDGVEGGALGPSSQVGPAIVIGLETGPAKLG